MKKIFTIAIIVYILVMIAVACACIKADKILNDKEIITVTDTIVVYKIDSFYIKCNDSLYLEIDSLNNKIKTLNEELFISNFKLERIKEYNRIAGNGNNITFLRGWINRVLNE